MFVENGTQSPGSLIFPTASTIMSAESPGIHEELHQRGS
jgi:hypothetical protein